MITDKAKAILIKSEGWRNKPYKDVVGIPTIGVGATSYQDGRKVTMNDRALTDAEVDSLLNWHFSQFEKGIKRILKVAVTNEQLNALTLFAYNFGVGGLQGSTLFKKVNVNPNDSSIANEVMKWVKARNVKTGLLEIFTNLVTRRQAEVELYFSAPDVKKKVTD